MICEKGGTCERSLPVRGTRLLGCLSVALQAGGQAQTGETGAIGSSSFKFSEAVA